MNAILNVIFECFLLNVKIIECHFKYFIFISFLYIINIVNTYLLLKMYKQKQDVKEYIIDQLNDDVGLDQHICDLHHYLLNQDYFIIGSYRAEQWLKKDSIFNAIEKIKDYEQSNFGQVSTDLSSSENVANMLAYILGEEILFESDIYQQIQFDKNILEEDDIKNLIEDLKES